MRVFFLQLSEKLVLQNVVIGFYEGFFEGVFSNTKSGKNHTESK